MFTGLVQAIAHVAWIKSSSTLTRYALTFPPSLLSHLTQGASVSVHGVCQTVVSIEGEKVIFEAIEETLKRTTLSTLVVDQSVNIERCAKLGDEIGGHLLSGHVAGTAEICDITQNIFTLRIESRWMKYFFSKGFIALNGASLTLVDVDRKKGVFSVHLIPETLRLTTFGKAKGGDKVNVEIDSQTQAIVETVERVLEEQKN